MRAVVVTTCDVRGVSGVKAAVGLTLCAQHNGCAFWSTVAAMNDDVSGLAKLPGCSVCSENPCCAMHRLLGCRRDQLIWGFFSCCVTDSLLYLSHSISCCAVQFDCDYLHLFF